MCTVCGDYDLCQNCENSGVHNHHVMLKIRNPSQAPAKIVAQYGPPLPKAAVQALSNVDLIQQVGDMFSNLMPQQPKRHPKSAEKFMARFVKESFPDKFEVQPGQEYSKSWTFRNNGEIAWPDDVVFAQSTGDEISSSVDIVRCKVNPGSEWTFSVNFKAPELPGRYTSFFRLATGSIKFGHKVQIDILVKDEEQKVAEPAKILDKLVDSANENKDDEAEKLEASQDKAISAAASEANSTKKPEVVPKFDMNLVPKNLAAETPKEIYMRKAETVQDPTMKEQLVTLFELGFVSFETNKCLMDKYKDLETVINMLLSGGLNESAIQAVF